MMNNRILVLFSMLTVMLASSSMLVTAFSTPCLTKTMTTATTTMTLYLSDETPSESDAAPAAAVDPNVKCPNCDLCDGSGRIAGGLGAVVSWLPIKAYRPCPNFIERGGNYQRTGQPLDEIAFGKDKKRGT